MFYFETAVETCSKVHTNGVAEMYLEARISNEPGLGRAIEAGSRKVLESGFELGGAPRSTTALYVGTLPTKLAAPTLYFIFTLLFNCVFHCIIF